MLIETNIDPKEFVRSVPRHELIDFILDADKAVAEVDFTVKLIKSLYDSLKNDLSVEEEEELKNELF